MAAGHFLISMVGLDLRVSDCRGARVILPEPDIIVGARRKSTFPAAAATVGKALWQEPVRKRGCDAIAHRALIGDINVCSATSSV